MAGSGHLVTFDPAAHAWVLDHRPTYSSPVLPFMYVLDLMAQAARVHAPGDVVLGCDDVTVHRWILCDAPLRLEIRVEETRDAGGCYTVEMYETQLESSGDAHENTTKATSPVASGTVRLGRPFPQVAPPPFPELDLADAQDPYPQGVLFHGPSMRVVERVFSGDDHTTFSVDAGRHALPYGALNPLLLDGLVQGMPLAHLERWSREIPPGQVGYPYRIERARFYAPAPLWGSVRAQVHFAGLPYGSRFPLFTIRALTPKGDLWTEISLVAALFSKGPVSRGSDLEVQRFVRDRRFVPGLGISRFEGIDTHLAVADVRATNWLPGTVAHIYRTEHDPELVPEEVAVKDHIAQRLGVHPSEVRITADRSSGHCASMPLNPVRVQVERNNGDVRVSGTTGLSIDIEGLRARWCAHLHAEPWGALDLFLALAGKFLRRIVFASAEALPQMTDRSCIYLGNHQTGVESLFVPSALGGLTRSWVIALAKDEHKTSWIGDILNLAERHPRVPAPKSIRYFDRSRSADLLPLVRELQQSLIPRGESLLVHVEGTRATHCRRPVARMSSVLIDMAIGAKLPIVPIRFTGGLPVEGTERHEFPVGYGKQDLFVGDPIPPEELAAIPYAGRAQTVVDRINALGPSYADETPGEPDQHFADDVRDWMERTGTSVEHAVILQALRRLEPKSEETVLLLQGLSEGRISLPRGDGGRWLGELADRLYGKSLPAAAYKEPDESR